MYDPMYKVMFSSLLGHDTPLGVNVFLKRRVLQTRGFADTGHAFLQSTKKIVVLAPTPPCAVTATSAHCTHRICRAEFRA